MKYATPKKVLGKKRKSRLTNREFAARVRKLVKQKVALFNETYKVGELVSQKYNTKSIGLVMEEVIAKKKYNEVPLGYHEVSAEYAAEHFYRYTAKVLWMHHPLRHELEMDQLCDMPIWDLKIKKEKKEKKVLESQ
jgi:hypothetical protein